MSLAARLLNVFAIPGEVFAGVRASRFSVGNWLIPALLSAALGVFTAIALVSQPSFQRQVENFLDHQKKTGDQLVKTGTLKQADADRALAFWRNLLTTPTLQKAITIAAGVAGGVRVFWWALILWLLGRVFLKVKFGYTKALEVVGLGLMINVLGGIVILLLMLNLPRLFSTSSLTMAVRDFDPTRSSPLLLVVASLFAIWLMGVFAVGLGKLAGVPFLRAAWFVFAAWLIQEPFLMLIGGGFF